jgi:hypothetical protein
MTKTVPVRVVEVQSDGGFDWGDAAIGAAAVVAVAAIGAGAFLARRHVLMCLLALTFVLAAAAGSAQAKETPGPWGVPTAVSFNVPGFQDGCPIESPDGRSLYFASTRPRFVGDLRTDIDIWVAHRDSADGPWGAPENLGEPVNSTFDDFCPTPTRGGRLFFVSRRVAPGVTCGMGDIYLTRLNPGQGWEEPLHLACKEDGGPNTSLDEQGPSYLKAGGPVLYYSSGIPSGPAASGDIFRSFRHGDGSFGPPELVTELSSPSIDIQPNVLRGGREVVFASNRPGGAGGQDVWTSTRKGPNDEWSTPVNLGAPVNTTAGETRPSLSWDGDRLYFGRAPGAASTADIYYSTR